jgi:transcriptional regulator with XRE-family HTH domain
MTQPATSRDWMGYRIARWRSLAGLSQRELAERIGVSREYISMIESGKRPVSTRRLLADLAHALGVRVEELTAQPIQPRNAEETVVYALAPAIRRALDGEPPLPSSPRPMDEVAADVTRAQLLRRTPARWDDLAELLPSSLVETAALEGDDGRLLYVRALFEAFITCQRTGYLDLARRCADLAGVVAAQVGEPVHLAATAYAIGQAALAGAAPHFSLATAERGAEMLQTSDSDSDDALGIAGMLHLHSALSAASLGQADRASDHLAEAAELAAHVVGDPWFLQPTPANVAVWAVSVACEQTDWDRVPELAAAVDTTRLRSASRIARLHADAGRGWYETGDKARAITELLSAMQTEALTTRVLPFVRELTAQLARDAGRSGGSTELRRLVSLVGVDPLAE